MKIIFLPLAFVSMLCLLACETNEPTPAKEAQPILTLRVDASYKTDQFENWVIIHNTDGKLLDYKEFEAGDLVELNSSKEIIDNKIHVTLFRYNKTDSTDYYNIETYLAINIGQEWKLKIVPYPSVASGNDIGGFKVNASGILSGYYFSIRANLGGSSNYSSWSSGTNTVNAELDLRDNQLNYFVYAADQFGNPRYKFLENVKNNDVYNFAYSDMSEFDHLVKVEAPDYTSFFVLVSGLEDGQPITDPGYDINSTLMIYGSPLELKNFTLGFLDRFKVYKTFVSANSGSTSLSYYRVGTRPESITLPFDATFSITNKKIQSFAYTGNQSVTMRSSEWDLFERWNTNSNNPKYKTVARWYVTAAEGNQIITEFPPEFSTRYSSFDMDKFTHINTRLLTESQSYSEFLDTKFKEKPELTNFEEKSIIIY